MVERRTGPTRRWPGCANRVSTLFLVNPELMIFFGFFSAISPVGYR